MGYNLVRTHLLTHGPHSPGYLSRCGFRIFLKFSPLLGEINQFDEHIFQMGWFNHQLVKVLPVSFFHLTVTGVTPRALPSAQWGVGQLSEKTPWTYVVSQKTLPETNSKSH